MLYNAKIEATPRAWFDRPYFAKKCPVCPVTAPQYCPSALFSDAFYPLSICGIVTEYCTLLEST